MQYKFEFKEITYYLKCPMVGIDFNYESCMCNLSYKDLDYNFNAKWSAKQVTVDIPKWCELKSE